MGSIKLKNINEEVIQEQSEEIKAVQEQAMMTEETLKREKTWEDPAVLSEDEEHINEHSRHYLLNNNTAKSIFSAMPVNYYDEEEKEWKEIDNSLEEKEDGYEAKCGKFTTKVSKAEKGKKVEINGRDLSLSWEYLGKQKAEGEKTFLNAAGMSMEIEGAKAGTSSVLQVEKSVKGAVNSKISRAVYENVEENTDIEYKLQGNNVKENILVKERAEEYKYRFALNTQGLKMRLSEDNTHLELYGETEKENGEKEEKRVFTIPCPYMYDANGENSEEVYYELAPETEGKYLFTVVASAEWINAPERVFPVTIDPQIITNNTNLIARKIQYRTISSSSSGTSTSAWRDTSGYSYIKVQKNSSIEYRTCLTIKRSQMNILRDRIVGVKLILIPVGSFSGYMRVNGSYKYYNSSNGNWEEDITNTFKSYSDTSDFTIYVEPSYYTYEYINGNFTESPIIEIEYLTNENTIPTKTTFTLAGIAEGEVNLATGEIATIISDVAAADSVMGLGISHIYKKSAENRFVGDNFRLSLDETFIKKDGNSVVDADYIYTDAKGDKHGFKDYYYYINNDNKKVYITADKSNIVVEADGTLKYGERICGRREATCRERRVGRE